MSGKMGKRRFLGKATVAVLTAPALLQGGLKVGHAADGYPGFLNGARVL
jgi:hypothetical protein